MGSNSRASSSDSVGRLPLDEAAITRVVDEASNDQGM